MSKHNYSQYSKKHANPVNEVVEPVVEDVETTVVAPVEPVEVKMESKIDTPIEPKRKSEAKKGVVTNCAKLNVRANPTTDADVIAVLDNHSEVEIDMARSAGEWFKICTAAGVEGFCMRKFVNAKL